ncbi:ATP-dependent RNA helicase DHX30 isoform X4 [Prionailurus iriomotensis]
MFSLDSFRKGWGLICSRGFSSGVTRLAFSFMGDNSLTEQKFWSQMPGSCHTSTPLVAKAGGR